MPPTEIAQLAIQLAGTIADRRQFIDAARLYIDYGTDDVTLQNAVNALAKGYQFTEAIRVVCSFSTPLTPGQRKAWSAKD